jgi:glycosyltransferase involved in cell wall biosynthesis
MYEDMTVRQALSVGASWVVSRAKADLDAWIDRQSRLYAHAAAVCTMSRWTADSVIEDYAVSPAKVHVVGAGANHVVDLAPDRDWSVPRFLFVGVGFNRKNGDAVLRAFEALHRARPEARLDVVGEHPPLDLEGVVGHGRLSLSDPGQRAQLTELYSRATCLVLPSRLEPFGIAYLEAASAGIASIAGNVGGTFVDNACGRLVDPLDDDAILGAMRELSDPDLARRLGAVACERARLYTWPLVAGRILRCFASALGRPTDELPEFL